MNTRALMAASSLFMASVGLTASFLPQEILTWLRAPSNPGLALLVQLGGALYIAFAMVNWTSRGSLIGGIYNRAVGMGNFTHFAIGAIALAKSLLAGQTALWVWVGCAAYLVFAVCFGLVLFGSPVKPTPAAS
ncbi:MAG TPA: hypothetical protein VN493_04180 [Thermoanaerobaculia bacterium]|nr:hypothetical protein [Thermoanaerobaculia bacterium]